MCPLCNVRHYASEEHVWKESKDGAVQVVGTARPIADAPVQSAVEIPAPAPQFDRKAYQREYMRKWRAARKGVK